MNSVGETPIFPAGAGSGAGPGLGPGIWRRLSSLGGLERPRGGQHLGDGPLQRSSRDALMEVESQGVGVPGQPSAASWWCCNPIWSSSRTECGEGSWSASETEFRPSVRTGPECRDHPRPSGHLSEEGHGTEHSACVPARCTSGRQAGHQPEVLR